jgi:asparagine synthase (glutamine-hydrolysing)
MDVEDVNRRWAETAGANTVDRLLALNVATYLVGDLLPKSDRMSMAHGLEVRSPFLDVDLAEYALRLPPSYKIRRGRLKVILKEAVRDLLPAEIVDRPKQGFGVPVSAWFRGDLGAYATQTLTGPSARLRQHLRPEAVASILSAHQSGRQDHGDLLWSLLTLEVFLRSRGW